jgi:hypothetical protein
MTNENQFQRVRWDGDQYEPSDDDGPDGMPLSPRGAGLSDSDLELLTLAARAFGAIRVECVEGENWLHLHFANETTAFHWNPLVHGDDALALSVRLKLDVTHRVVGGERVEVIPAGMSVTVEPYNGDPYAATRRAITRAAADIEVARAKKQA